MNKTWRHLKKFISMFGQNPQILL